jgi:hypothetical protein
VAGSSAGESGRFEFFNPNNVEQSAMLEVADDAVDWVAPDTDQSGSLADNHLIWMSHVQASAVGKMDSEWSEGLRSEVRFEFLGGHNVSSCFSNLFLIRIQHPK